MSEGKYNLVDVNKDPLGAMLKDYYRGNIDVFLNVWSDTMEMSAMRGAHMFRQFSEMDELEKIALGACRGRVLDAGAGSGCHSLILQEQGLKVDAIDISPGCVEVMTERGVLSAALCDVFAPFLNGYDTVLMLMNGTGICGNLSGLNIFLQNLESLLAKGGQLIIDSTDMTEASAENGEQPATESYCGETQLVMIYKGLRSDPFNWLYIDFPLLHTIATFHGLQCKKLFEGEAGQYLARITA